jgi:2-methylisocitrate lyase-like PEP mutase family enzyme
MTSQSEKAARFAALHKAPGAFVIANPWDAGSARLLAGLGFEALATSSGASAGIPGKSFTVAELQAAGVKRISLATSLYRAAMTGLLEAAREVKDKGSFGYLERCISTPDLVKLMKS